jgi:erythromycin esterase-like protein
MNKDLKEGLRIIKKAQLDKQDDSYWSLIIDNLIAYANDSWGSTANNPLGSTVRDKAMANNLKFLVDKKYKGEKVIVWAANTHVMKYTDQLKSKAKFFDKVIFENMGTNFVKDSLSAAGTYVLGFASYRGEAGRLGTNQFSVEAPHKNGLENWMPGSAAYGFVDFKSYNSKFSSPTIPFFMKSPAHYTIPTKVVKVPWNLVYDGIFFIRDMYAAKEVK